MIVDSFFNSKKFRRKRNYHLVNSILNLFVSTFVIWHFFLRHTLDNDFSYYLKVLLPITIVLLIIQLYRTNVFKHNLRIKNQIDEIELNDQEIIITNYAEEKIIIRKDSCMLIPVNDQVWQLFGRHHTSLLLTLENGSCFYIYAELFNTQQVEDWKSDDENKRYYTV
jgi:hypothetical protein